MKIAIQGGRASFHDITARYYFGENIDIEECESFRQLCFKLSAGEVDYAVMAVDNSIAASILPNYALIEEFGFKIIGEVYLQIKQYIMCVPDTKEEHIRWVMSHYMALNQCEEYLLNRPMMERREYHDTADSAKYIKEHHSTDIAAIASKYACELYGLKLLEPESIETYKNNFTRFFILSTDKKFKDETANKATISFRLSNEVGALSKVLKIIVDNEVNLTKIQSLPVFGKAAEYRFHVDCEWSDYAKFKKSIAINSIVEDLKILGEYKKGEFVNDYSRSK
ncbi:prephenate dehydratase [Cytophaga hutchinsonii]|uniref:prephenate dehydratase n=1 Tax=Cytophaga hutchinsonii (strain ATCC 33406 / DSM 1761 / CIP 103989 / NBRC 15051 / NCIMB 9469 / D465) TaxID=269798 RepID=A0A6N4SP33_CYTH3|nr:prephenate dehydratase domain-containing protein [Cytophaga hutchinsonii]ABG58051.1 prephenate dehydratase [Cytophaga hutchinsonii ATCC 33406]SFX12349.1 prephenate dehydratase [Cytophaga hutchinsonii ATCC 33406]